jgi:DNA helicase-2/ATP-dependent DNA helicase PcrA
VANLDANCDIDHRADAIANYQDGVLVCLAGPGTGKTYSFLRRIEALTAERHVDVDKICYFTFIREISKAFAADYEEDQESGVDETPRPRISTLHSFACCLIRNQGFRHGFDGALYFMSIADRKDDRSQVFLNDLLPFVERGQLRTVARLRKVLEKAKEAWRDNIDPNSLAEPVSAVLPFCLDLSRAYRLIDWDQAVPFAHTLFQSLDEPPRWIARIEHFLVDEYQDFNRAEQAFINTLAPTARSMVIVGDDDQSLYSGRGGSPDGLRELYYSDGVDQVSLVRCYRCKSEILKVANTFLAAMRPDPRPMVSRYDGGELACRGFKSRKAEIAYLAEFLKSRIEVLPEEPRPKDGIVCLFPNWKALDSYMACLMEAEIPCYSRKTPPHPERTWLERALALISNPEQRFVERLLLEDFSDIKPRHKQAMVELVLEHDISPVEAMDILASTGKLSEAATSAGRTFRDLCQALSSQEASLIANKLAEHLTIEIPDLCEQIDTFIQQLDQLDQEDAIRNLCDTLIPESAPPPEDPRAVLCLTMHGSKGLTKKTVVMPGLEDAWLPGGVAQDDVDERKRLFYVALTRATDQVLITYPRTRPRGDPLNYDAPGRGQESCFVRQSGIHLVSHR